MITGPLRDRFGLVARLDYYDDDELQAIVARAAGILDVDDRRRRARGRSPAARGARRASPTACCAGCATSPRCAATARSTADIARDGLAAVRRRRARPRQGRPGDPHRAVPAVRRRAGRAVDAGDQRRRAARDGRGRVRAVPHPAGADRPHAARPRGDAGRLRAHRPDAARAAPAASPACSSSSTSLMAPRLGVFGGSGFYEFLDGAVEHAVDTPYGAPAAPVVTGSIGGHEVAFIARHGVRHDYQPHRVPYRATCGRCTWSASRR